MTETKVHLENVTRAAQIGVALAAGVAVIALAAMLAAGVGLAPAAAVAAVLLAVGAASGGFGLIGRVGLPPLPQRRRDDAAGSSNVTPLRVPQTR
jgi:hypothetical protein